MRHFLTMQQDSTCSFIPHWLPRVVISFLRPARWTSKNLFSVWNNFAKGKHQYISSGKFRASPPTSPFSGTLPLNPCFGASPQSIERSSGKEKTPITPAFSIFVCCKHFWNVLNLCFPKKVSLSATALPYFSGRLFLMLTRSQSSFFPKNALQRICGISLERFTTFGAGITSPGGSGRSPAGYGFGADTYYWLCHPYTDNPGFFCRFSAPGFPTPFPPHGQRGRTATGPGISMG